MTAVCGSDGQWTPNPGGVTCSPRPTQVITLASPQTTILVSTPIQTSTPTGENKRLLLCSPAHYFSACKHTCLPCMTIFYYVLTLLLLAGSSNEEDTTCICTSCYTSVAITAVVSCAVSFILGGLVGAVVHYCTVRKKSNCQKCYSLTVARNKQQQQQPVPVYEDIVGQSQNIELKENVAYGPVQQ